MVPEMPTDPCKKRVNKPLVESDTDLDPESYTLQNFKLYQTQAKFYLVGRDKSRLRWRILEIYRLEYAELIVYEDPSIYTRRDCDDLLNRLKEGNRLNGGLNFVTKVYGIIGFIKFLEPYYMVLVTKRRMIGSICGHAIYGIDESQLITVQHSSVHTELISSKEERRYKKLFCSIDLTKNFFFSYTYRIMWSLQKNVIARKSRKTPYDDMFVWNSFLTWGIRQQVQSLKWTVALVHGFFKQVKHIACKNIKMVVSLVARRSRYFAGTRYFKRGLNDEGRVANDVETEQLVSDEACSDLEQISSVVQHRGSIPLHWSQETSVFIPKPDIKVYKNDPNYEATSLHFQNLSDRYGNPIVVLNLVKEHEKKPRETVVSTKFCSAIEYLNSSLPMGKKINYIQWDFNRYEKRPDPKVLQELRRTANDVLHMIGFYCLRKNKCPEGNITCDIMGFHLRDQNVFEQEDSVAGKQDKDPMIKKMYQKGVLRSNCIDCIDRTNAAQYEFGSVALGHQMFSLGLSFSSDITEDIETVLLEMYLEMGDALGLQYAGSAAHNKVLSERLRRCNLVIRILKFFRSMTRFYNNVFQDGYKQDAISIFLGNYHPEVGKIPLWELDTEYCLQLRRFGEETLNDIRISLQESFSAEDMLEQMNAGNFVPGIDAGNIESVLKLFNDNFTSETIRTFTKEGYNHNLSESLNNTSNAESDEVNSYSSYATLPPLDACSDNESYSSSISGASFLGSVSYRHYCESETDIECETSAHRECEENLSNEFLKGVKYGQTFCR